MATPDAQNVNRSGFREIDNLEGGRQDHLFRFLDFQTRNPQTRALKTRMIELLRLRSGARVLDAGCGLGDDVRDLAEIVGPDGQVTGLDFSAATLDEARRRTRGVDLPVTWVQGDVQELPFDDNAFDAARSERTFMHLADPEKGLRELVRVTRPGGRIVLSDPDWGSVSQVTGIPQLQAKLRAHNDSVAPRGSRIGARLPVLFWQCGLEQIVVLPDLHFGDSNEWRQAEAELGRPQPWYASGSTIALDEGYLTAEEHRALADHERELVEVGIHCRTIVNYIVAGTVPRAG
jgi:SAM-dependent methyltransferase